MSLESMDSERGHFAEKVQTLSDLELAVLVCLVADQHVIIECADDLMNEVSQELTLIAANIFGLSWAVLDCSDKTTLDDFGSGILVKEENDDYFGGVALGKGGSFSPPSSTGYSKRRTPKSPQPFSPLDSHRIANVVVAKNLNRANAPVQVQALELMRGKRNFTRTAVHAAPKPFLFIALNVSNTARMSTHLSDQFFISHSHQDEDELPNLEDFQMGEPVSEDDASTSSVVRSSPYMLYKRKPASVMFSQEELVELAGLTSNVDLSSEVRAYLHNIVVFMRLHRAVAGGISAVATRHFNALAHALAPLHGLSYITPSLVALAARKIYPHRIIITSPENERSMQWGSSLDAVKAVLEGVTVEDVIEEVLQSVEEPL